MPLDITLEELFRGVEIEVEINKQIICPICRGSGAKSHEHVKTCHSCGGHGVKIMRQQLAPGFVQQVQVTCDVCGGRGKIVQSKCAACAGEKVKRGSSQMTVQVERGMGDGQSIVFEGEADQSPDQRAGDVKFTLRQRPHPVFTRKGDNLYMTQAITLKEALLGFEKKVAHLDGKDLPIARKTVTQPGFVQTIKGQGMPKFGFPSERGDLFVEYSVVFPTTLTAEQQKLAAKLFEK
nr:DnaJ- protein scj1 [Polyrhizophydium stewartii]